LVDFLPPAEYFQKFVHDFDRSIRFTHSFSRDDWFLSVWAHFHIFQLFLLFKSITIIFHLNLSYQPLKKLSLAATSFSKFTFSLPHIVFVISLKTHLPCISMGEVGGLFLLLAHWP
jgi:hypothetical protein